MGRYRLSLTGGAVLAASVTVILAIGGLAWACTVQARILTISPPLGPANSTIVIKGAAPVFGLPIQARWNDVKGDVIGSGVSDAQGSFSLQAKIPQAPPGVYYIVAEAGEAGLVRTAFEIVPANKQVSARTQKTGSSGEIWSGFKAGKIGPADLTGQPSSAGFPTGTLGGAFTAVGAGAGLAVGLVSLRRRHVATRLHTDS